MERIKEKAEDVKNLFKEFRRQQIEEDNPPTLIAKQNCEIDFRC